MIIDLILDRKDRKNSFIEKDQWCTTPKYNAKRFYDDVTRYYKSFGDIVEPIANAMDSGEENDVKRELSRYIIDQNYNLDILTYINSVNWL